MAEYIKPENDRYIKLSQALEVLDSCACWWAHDQMELIPAADVVPLDYHERCLQIEVKNRLALERKSRWIPVSERLPNYGETVLAYGSRGGIYTARFERARTKWDRDNWWKLNSKSHVCNPTHWQPLPEPPKETIDA